MIEKILTSVIFGLISKIGNAITDWMRKKELEALKTKAEALEGKVESMKQSSVAEEKIDKVVKTIAKTNAKATTLRERLASMAEHANKQIEEAGDE